MKVIKISALWCPSCLIMNKVVRKIMEDYPQIDLLELDIDMDMEEVKKYEVGKILPVVIFLTDSGTELERLGGEIDEFELRKIVDKYEKVN